MRAQAWNASLTASFLLGCSLGPNGAYFDFFLQYNVLAVSRRTPNFETILG
jgi:hypothetical protein